MTKRRLTKEYRTIDISTVDGLRAAERLQKIGWKIDRCGLFYIYMSRVREIA